MRSTFAAACVLVLSSTALASSHREAPFITKNPKVDNTDFYMFNSYENGRGNFVTLLANFQPLQAPYGGPNYFTMDPDALYEILIDNTGDGVEDLTFQFKFSNDLLNGGRGAAHRGSGRRWRLPVGRRRHLADSDSPHQRVGPIGFADGGFNAGTGFQGLVEHYTAGVVAGPRRVAAAQPIAAMVGGATTFGKPMDNVGSKTFPGGSYNNYARSFIYTVTIPGCATPAQMFVGQRAEGFAVNLGPIFDLVNAPASVIAMASGRNAVPVNPIGYSNITTIALEVAKTCLQPSATETVIGGWSTASVRQARVINPTATYATPSREGGAWAQVSRLGSPLVNEVVIGLPDKDLFNSSEPKNDAANFAKYVFNPTLPKLLEILFMTDAPTTFPRNDLVAAFLTGVPGVNKFAGTTNPPTEMLRLNTAIPATAAASQNNLGALQCFTGQTATTAPSVVVTGNALCDPAGFPDGRRPGDDVVDIALRVVMGGLLDLNDAPSGAIPFNDGVLQDVSQFDVTFPYLKNPNPGVP